MKSLHIIHLFLLSLILILPNCASTRSQSEITQKWVGKNKQQLLSEWGEPNEHKVIEGEERVIYVKEVKHTVRSLSGDVRYLENEVGSRGYYNTYAGMSFLCVISFTIDKSSVIESVEFEGNDCQKINLLED